MTRKDYIKFARLIDIQVRKPLHDQTNDIGTAYDVVKDMALGIAGILQDDNPRFDMDRFMIASFGEDYDRVSDTYK